MRKLSNHLFTSIVNVDLVNLTSTVQETVSFNAVDDAHKNFTSAELWNIQRHAKSRVQRRYLYLTKSILLHQKN